MLDEVDCIENNLGIAQNAVVAQAARGVQPRPGPGGRNLLTFLKWNNFVALVMQHQHPLGTGTRP